MKRREDIQTNLTRKRERLEFYYQREEEMLSQDGIKSYAMGSRNISRYDTTLREIQSAIRTLEGEISDLEQLLTGNKPRKSVGVILRDW